MILSGETLSWAPPRWRPAAVFGAVNAIYMPLVEEPGLTRRFGEDYVTYRNNVPRWIRAGAPGRRRSRSHCVR